MKKVLSLFMLLCMVCTGAWAELGGNLQASNEGVWEHPYFIHNCAQANPLWVRETSGSTGNGAKAGAFAFVKAEGTDNYYIYSIDNQKWLSYEKVNAFADGSDKVILKDQKEHYFKVAYGTCTHQDATTYNQGYTFSPYCTDGAAATRYLNWHGGASGYTGNQTMGLYANGFSDAGSVWVLVEPPFTSVNTLQDLSTANWYYVKLKDKYVKYNASAGNLQANYDNTDNADEAKYVFVGNYKDGYKVYNVAADAAKVLGAANKNTNTAVTMGSDANAHTFKIELYRQKTSGNSYYWQLRESSTTNAFLNWQNNGNHQIIYWADNAGKGDVANQFVFEKVEDVLYHHVAYEYKIDDETIESERHFVANNGTYPELKTYPFYQYTAPTGNVTASSSNVFSLTWNGPFKKGKYYQLQNRETDSYVASDKTGNYVHANTIAANNEPNHLWYFVRKPGTALKFYVMSVNGRGMTGGATTGKTNITMTDTPTAYTLFKKNDNGTFCLKYEDSEACVGKHASYQGSESFPTGHSGLNNGLCTWLRGGSDLATDDPGSYFTVQEFDESVFDADPTIVGSYIATDKTKIESYKGEKTAANLKAALLTLNSEVTLNPNKYYTIRETVRENNQNYMVVAPNADVNGDFSENFEIGCHPSTDAANYSLVNSLFQFVPSDSKYNIKHVNSGLNVYPATHDTHATITTNTAGTYSVVHYSADNTKVGFVNADGVYLNTNAALTRVDGWNGGVTIETSAGDRWTVKEVTEIPFTFNAASDYATFCSPVNVEIPEGVKAYIATSVQAAGVGEWLYVDEIADVVPANTGVLLIGQGKAGKTVDFVITTSEGQNVEKNQFIGTTARRTGFTEDSHYGLKLVEGTPALALNGGTQNVPANKAILPADVVPNAGVRQLSFNFNEEQTTGVKSVEKVTNAIELYDLNGKRVVNPTTGIYMTNTGRKVFVK